jgi:hypothetical protein
LRCSIALQPAGTGLAPMTPRPIVLVFWKTLALSMGLA